MEGNDMFIDDALEQDAGLSLESDANDFNVQEMAEDVPQFPEMMEEVVLESDGNDCDAAVLDCEVCEEFMLFAADGTLLSHTVGEAVSLDEPQPIQFDELGMDEAPILADDANESSEYAFLGNDDMQAMSITPFSNTLNVSPMTFNNVSAAGGTTQNINVTSNISWSVISHATAWLIPSISSGSGNRTFTVRIVASGSTVARTGSVSVSGGGIIRSIQFHQLGTTGGGGGGGANLTVSHAGWNSIPSGGWTSPSITVTSNITWNLSRSHTWLTPSLGLGNWTGTRTLTVTVGQNTGAARSGNVTVSGSNITRNISFAQLAGTPASNLTVSHAGWNSIPSGGWTSPTITVTSNITWNLSRSHAWLTPSLGLGNWTGTRTLTVTVGQNTGAARSGNVTASGGGITRNISFAQLAGAPANPPPAPTNLRLNGSAGTTSIPLTWNASAGATSYDVFRSGTLLGNVGGTSANVTGLAPGTSHSFTVRAKNAHGSSGNSNTLTASTLPSGGGYVVGQRPPGKNFNNTTFYWHPGNTFAQSNNSGVGQCTWHCFGRAREKLGVILQFTRTYNRHANLWINLINRNAHAVGSTPFTNSIAVFRGPGVNGHVVFVERVVGSTIYYTEANRTGNNWGSWTPQCGTVRRTTTANFTNLYGGLLGYIYP